MSSPILEVKNVSISFGETQAVRDVSLRLDGGETHIFFGSAGSGKTTLLKAVIGLIPVDSGSICLFGEEVASLDEHQLYPLRARTGFVFQEGGLFDSMCVGDNVAYPFSNQQTRTAAANIQNTVRETLRFVELEHTYSQFPSELSGGMRRRVGIARAIVTDPPLVLYDSPTAGLDPITANTIMALVAKQRDSHRTASLIVSHRYQDGEIMARFSYDQERQELIPAQPSALAEKTNFIVMKEGAIVFSGRIDALEASNDPYVRRFIRHEE